MSVRQIATTVLMWIFVICWGILIGGMLYEATVITPLWAHSPPESLLQWGWGSSFAEDRLGFYGTPLLPVALLSTVVMLITAWPFPAHRKWLLVTFVGVLIFFNANRIMFVPLFTELIQQGAQGLAEAEVVDKTQRFVSYQWLRLALMLVCWVTALRALCLRFDRAEKPQETKPQAEVTG